MPQRLELLFDWLEPLQDTDHLSDPGRGQKARSRFLGLTSPAARRVFPKNGILSPWLVLAGEHWRAPSGFRSRSWVPGSGPFVEVRSTLSFPAVFPARKTLPFPEKAGPFSDRLGLPAVNDTQPLCYDMFHGHVPIPVRKVIQ